MTIWERFTKGVSQVFDRDAVHPNRSRPAEGLADKLDIPKLSDEQLAAELERRRRLRGQSAHRRPAGEEEIDAAQQARRARMKTRPLSKSFASLELGPGASRSEVEASFRRLLRQYHPDRHAGDPEQHKSAIALATSLIDAYLAILAAVDRKF